MTEGMEEQRWARHREEHRDMIANIARIDRALNGDGQTPGLFTRVALLEDFVSMMRKLFWSGIIGIVGLWLNLLWQMYEHFAATRGA